MTGHPRTAARTKGPAGKAASRPRNDVRAIRARPVAATRSPSRATNSPRSTQARRRSARVRHGRVHLQHAHLRRRIQPAEQAVDALRVAREHDDVDHHPVAPGQRAEGVEVPQVSAEEHGAPPRRVQRRQRVAPVHLDGEPPLPEREGQAIQHAAGELPVLPEAVAQPRRVAERGGAAGCRVQAGEVAPRGAPAARVGHEEVASRWRARATRSPGGRSSDRPRR